MWVVVTGNPLDGIEHIGPFNTSDHATDWADEHIEDEEWWVAPMTTPKSYLA